MKLLWTRRRVAAPPAVVWDLFTDTRRWPDWGPSVRRVDHSAGPGGDGPRLGPASRGRVSTVLGRSLPFEVTAFDPPHRWAWRVAGVAATDHRVEPEADGTSVAAIGVPWIAAPYLAVATLGLRRLARLAERAPERARADASRAGTAGAEAAHPAGVGR